MSWSRDRWARVGLGVLVALLLSLAVSARWRAGVVVDDRTYIEMAAGVRDHGLPYTLNTWSDRLPEARPSFLIPRHGKLWGQYPPLYPYVLAVALKLGGLAAMYKLTALLLAAFAVVMQRLGRHTFDDDLAGTLGAWLAILGLPICVGSVQTLAMPLAFVISAGTLLEGVRAVRERKARFYVGVGVLAALGIATHLLELAVGGAVCGVVVAAGSWEVRALARRAALTLGPLALVLLPVSLLDHVRFGTYNPISYGPCPWWMCTTVLEGQLSAVGLVMWAMPALLPLALAAGIGYLVRRRTLAVRIAAPAVVIAASLVIPEARARLASMSTLLWGFFCDVDLIDLSYTNPRYGSLGWMSGDHIILGLLETSPWIALALYARKRLAGRPKVLAVFVAPTLGLLLELATLARFHTGFGLGWPYLIPRYVLYIAPIVAALAGGHLARLRPKRWHLVAGAAVTVLVVAWFAPLQSDESWLRRFFLLRVTLVLGLATAGVALVSHRRRSARFHSVATLLAVLAVATGVGVTFGEDDIETVRQLRRHTRRMERFEAQTPTRLALAGWGPDTDPILSLRAERDIHYVDFVETKTWDGFRQIIDKWNDEGRPIYGVFPHDIVWPYADWDVPAVRIDAQEEFWKIGPPRRRFDAPIPPQPPPEPAPR